MKFFYNFIFFLFLVLSLPKTLRRVFSAPEYRGMFWRRFFCPALPASPAHPRLWLNGVSVGEVISLQPLVKELERRYPGIRLVISCTTGTGYKRAKSLYAEHDVIGYPFDFSWVVRRFLDKIRPVLFVSVELDLWPNFMLACQERSLTYLVVSGRLSESSTRGYEKVQFLLRQPFKAVTLFLAQDKVDAERALRIGLPEGHVRVGGNLKFDLLAAEAKPAPETARLFADKSRKNLVLASTHNPEERQILEVLSKIGFRENFKDWRLVITPRHPERRAELCALLDEMKWPRRLWSEIKPGDALGDEVLLVDQIGILSGLYAHADLCFVGGSLIPHGGQNMIEPAARGVAVLFGPHVANFREASELLLQAQAAVQVRDLEHLCGTFSEYLASSEARLKLGQRAAAAIASKKGVAKKVAVEIERLLEG